MISIRESCKSHEGKVEKFISPPETPIPNLGASAGHN
jgi:hypothetical protein